MQYLTRAQVTLYGHTTLADWTALPVTDLSATTQVNMQVKVKQNTKHRNFQENLAHEHKQLLPKPRY